MPLQTSRRVLQLERKLSEKRRKLMELASQCANEVTEHDWDSIIKLSYFYFSGLMTKIFNINS